MKKLFFVLFLFVGGSAIAQSDSTFIDEDYDSEIKLPITGVSLIFRKSESGLPFYEWQTNEVARIEIRQLPTHKYVLGSPVGIQLSIDDAGVVYLDGKIIGMDEKVAEWAQHPIHNVLASGQLLHAGERQVEFFEEVLQHIRPQAVQLEREAGHVHFLIGLPALIFLNAIFKLNHNRFTGPYTKDLVFWG